MNVSPRMGLRGFFTPLNSSSARDSNVVLIPSKADVRWFDMPAAQVELDNRNETLYWIFDFGHGKKGFRMCHEAIPDRQISFVTKEWNPYFVIRSSIDLGSKMNVGRVTLFKSAPGRNCDMICESTTKPTALQYSSHKF